MARQHSLIQNLKSIAGVGFIGLGVFILFGNLTDAAAQLSYLLGIAAEGAKTLGVLNTVGLAASHALQAYLFAHKEFLRGLYRILISFWPPLLVIAGTALLPHGFTDEVKKLPKKILDMSISLPFVRRVSRGRVEAGGTVLHAALNLAQGEKLRCELW